MADKTEKKKGAKAGAPESEKNPDTKTEASSAAKSCRRRGVQEHCQVAKCKQPVRAKGYCRKHYIGWRRGDVGKKHRYKICSKEACRKPAVLGGQVRRAQARRPRRGSRLGVTVAGPTGHRLPLLDA